MLLLIVLSVLDRAISPIAEDVDITALDSFTALIQRNPRLSVNATHFLAVKIHSQSQKEALFALDVGSILVGFSSESASESANQRSKN